MTADPQVALLRKIEEPASLHEILVRKFDVERRKAGDLFTIRMMLCGRKKGEAALGSILENLAVAGSETADRTNPFVTQKCLGTTSINGVLIDYGGEFMQLIEGPERHVCGYMTEMQKAGDLLNDVHVLFLEDDVERFLPTGWLNIDKVPPACVGGDVQDMDDDDIAESVIRDLANLKELGVSAGDGDKTRGAFFADNAKVNFPKLFPKSNIVDTYIESELFLTLNEFEQNFCRLPVDCREGEVAHPVEDPLRY